MPNPKFKRGDIVSSFVIEENGERYDYEGEVYIVDANGTFMNPGVPSYDIMVENWMNSGEKMLVKHVPEKGVVLKKKAN